MSEILNELSDSEATAGAELRVVPEEGFKRAHTRFELKLDITAEILIPEDTFRPHALSGYTIDVSGGGMKAAITSLPQDLYVKLLARPRFVRIAFADPNTGSRIKITGKIAWMDYHKPRSGDRTGTCHLGLAFKEDEGIDLTEYRRFMDGLRPLKQGESSGAQNAA